MSLSVKKRPVGQAISKLIPLGTSNDDELTDPKCAVCSQVADKRCGNCLVTFYCGSDHQKQDWKDHRKICCPFQVKYSDELGRYLVASRDLEERTLVIHEPPFAFAPYDVAAGSEHIPMCLGCCYRMSDIDRKCTLCHWPVCSQECEEMSSHAYNECPIFQERKIYPPPQPDATYSSILLLRIILQKEKSPSLWQKFLEMEHHAKLRSAKESCNDNDALILENLREYLDPSTLMCEEEIKTIIGRVSVNAFGVTRREEGKNDDTIGRGVFLTTGIVAHGCVPNAVWGISYSPTFEIVVKTAVGIKKGETITPTYSDIWNSLGTYQRHCIMLERSHFQCKCKRCLDPKELGTYLSAIRCAKCQEMFLLPKNPLDLSDTALWQCENDKCAATEIQLTIINLVEDIQYEVETVIVESRLASARVSTNNNDQGCEDDSKDKEAQDKEGESSNSNGSVRGEDLEELYEKFCGTILHENHFIVRMIEKEIVGKLFPLLPSCSFAELNSFIFHCENLIRVNDILTPGYCGHGGALRNHLCQGLIQKKTKAVKEGSVSSVFKTSKAFSDHLRRIDKIKKEAAMHWENDPDSSPMNWESFVTRVM